MTFAAFSALSAPPLTCDIFCRVVDNFGDIGVAWRLARQLNDEHRMRVRLMVDDLTRFHALVPAIIDDAPAQTVDGVEIIAWRNNTVLDDPAAFVIETFACEIPLAFQQAMATTKPQPVWINLEYLSAETWIAGHHLLASPHPTLALTKTFFFPGFTAESGGLIRERDLLARRDQFEIERPTHQPRVLVFSYDHAPLEALLQANSNEQSPVEISIVESGVTNKLKHWCGVQAENARNGAPMLDFHVLALVPQDEFDRRLWEHDILFVRGEDSFVRAQWAARPFIWHIYPQADGAHRVKLNAFLDLYCQQLPAAPADALRALWMAWNAPSPDDMVTAWPAFIAHLPVLDAHAKVWAEQLAASPDLASRLLSFYREKAKIQGFADP